MTSQILKFSGVTKWCKVQKPDEKYDNFQVPLYMDDESKARFKKSGIQLRVKTDEDGEFVVFKRPHFKQFGTELKDLGPPAVLIGKEGDNTPFDGLIGNGSKITVKVTVYDTNLKGKGHRLEAVLVTDLVVFESSNDVTKLPF